MTTKTYIFILALLLISVSDAVGQDSLKSVVSAESMLRYSEDEIYELKPALEEAYPGIKQFWVDEIFHIFFQSSMTPIRTSNDLDLYGQEDTNIV